MSTLLINNVIGTPTILKKKHLRITEDLMKLYVPWRIGIFVLRVSESSRIGFILMCWSKHIRQKEVFLVMGQDIFMQGVKCWLHITERCRRWIFLTIWSEICFVRQKNMGY